MAKAKELATIANTIDCFYDPACSPCNDLWNATVKACTADAMKAYVPKCFEKICTDVKGMYQQLFVLFIVFAVALAMSLVSVCTKCGCASKPVFTPLLGFGTVFASVMAIVVGAYSIGYMNTPYKKVLDAFGTDFTMIKSYLWPVFLPCYLGIIHMIWAQLQWPGNYFAYKSSAAVVAYHSNGDSPMGASTENPVPA